MRARTIVTGFMAVSLCLSLVLIAWGTASSEPFHNVDDCTVCHDFESFDCGTYVNLEAIKCTITTPYSGDRVVRFSVRPDDYVDAVNNPPQGICQVCHTLTSYYRNDGTGLGHQPGSDCSTCHSHCDEFAPSGGTGPGHGRHTQENSKFGDPLGCADCHGASFDIFKDGEPLATTTVCDTCHSPGGAIDGVDDAAVGAKVNWDLGVYQEDGKTLRAGKEQWCGGCHDGGTAFSRSEIIAPTIVDNLDASYVPSEWSHSTGNPGPGEFYGADVQYHPAVGDGSATCTWIPNLPAAGSYEVYARWTSYWNRASSTPYTISYQGGSETVWVNQQESGGKWNLLGTYPFAGGVSGNVVLSDNATGGNYIIADAVRFVNVDNAGAYAPNVVGDNLTYGHYENGHKFSCTVCHDSSRDHIDHNQRTYEVDETTCDPGPCVVINSYEAGYRLRSVAGQRPMVMPKHEVANPNELDPDEYALCFMCHDSDPILSMSPVDTNFKSDNDPYNRNFHQYHLGMEADIADSDWDAVINGPWGVSLDSMATCTTCHNVHGSPSPTLIRHGELISSVKTSDKVPAFDFCYASDIDIRDCTMVDPYPDSVGGNMYFYQGPERGNYVCMDCHSGYRYYYRTPLNISTPVSPKVRDARAAPVSVPNDGTMPILFTAFVVDPNDNLSSVNIDLLPVGGSSSQPMYDDGTNGDSIAGDEIYSYLLSGTSASVGDYALTITAEDVHTNTGTSDVAVVVHDDYAATVIVDNLEGSYVCDWGESAGLPDQRWGPDVRHRLGGGDGSCTAIWTFDVPADGNYRVYARWTAHAYRATSVPYTIHYDGGSDTVPVNQQELGGQWNLLGTYPFVATSSGSVVLSDDATGGPVSSRRNYIIADAIRLAPAP